MRQMPPRARPADAARRARRLFQRGRDQPGQLVVDAVVAGDDLGALDHPLAAAEVADETPRLADEQDAGGDVPWREPRLPEAVEAPRRDPREVERRRAEPAQAGNLGDDGVGDGLELRAGRRGR